MLKDLLKYLNFPEKEAVVYLSLIELGQAKAREIALKTDLNRTTVYDLCELLMKKGLISKYKKRSGTYFSALEPNRLLDYLDREKEEQNKQIVRQKKKVEELLPQLMSLQNIFSSKPKVKFFEGIKGMREAYEDTLTCKGTILAYANVETVHAGIPNFFPEYYQRRSRKKIPINAIFTKNKLSLERAKLDQAELRQTRFLPESEMTFSPEVNIYNNKMLIASWQEKMAIIIESKELADLQKLIFNLVWESLPRK